nr:MFS transporter [Streptomyces sp. CBMA123]
MWEHADFRRLWAGQTLSTLGANMVAVAVPLLAAVSLGASVFQMGLLLATEFLPYLLISLFVGVWLDRRPKKLIIVAADVARSLILLSVPLLAWAGLLSVPLLLVVVFGTGACSTVSDIGSASILPALVEREDLVEGNSKLELSSSVSNIGGRTVGGLLVQLLTGPVVILLDVFAFGLAAACTLRIRRREPVPERPTGGEPSSLWQEIGEGLGFVFGNPTLRFLVPATFLINFSAIAIDPLFLVFVTRTLDLPGILVGALLAGTGAGSLVGALLAARLGRLLPFGRMVVWVTVAMTAVELVIPAATLMPAGIAFAMLMFVQIAYAVLVISSSVNIRSYQAAITPDTMQGRMNASTRMIVMAGTPFGAMAGGALGALLGTRPAIVVCAGGIGLAALLLGLSPVRRATGAPAEAPTPTPATI